MRRNRRPIGLLSVALVLATAFAVAGVAMLVLPDLPFAAAARARRDRRAAGRRRRDRGRPPGRDAAQGRDDPRGREPAQRRHRAGHAAHGGRRDRRQRDARRGRHGLPAGRGRSALLGGWLVAEVASVVRRRVSDPVLDTTLSLARARTSAYLLAEGSTAPACSRSSSAGLILGHRSPEIQSAGVPGHRADDLADRAVPAGVGRLPAHRAAAARRWSWRRRDERGLANGPIAVVLLAVSVTVVVARIVWVFPATYLPRLLPGCAGASPSRRPGGHVALLSVGRDARRRDARGGVHPADRTLAGREASLIAAFAVVAGTLLRAGHARCPASSAGSACAGPDQAQDALQQALVMQRAVEAGRGPAGRGAPGPRPADVVDSLEAGASGSRTSVWERLGRSRTRPGDPAQRVPPAAGRDARRRSGAVVVDVRRSGQGRRRGARAASSSGSTRRRRCCRPSTRGRRASDAERPRPARRAGRVPAPARRADRRRPRRDTDECAGLRRDRERRLGARCGCACAAGTSAAATPRRAGTPRRTSTRRRTR